MAIATLVWSQLENSVIEGSGSLAQGLRNNLRTITLCDEDIALDDVKEENMVQGTSFILLSLFVTPREESNSAPS